MYTLVPKVNRLKGQFFATKFLFENGLIQPPRRAAYCKTFRFIQMIGQAA